MTLSTLCLRPLSLFPLLSSFLRDSNVKLALAFFRCAAPRLKDGILHLDSRVFTAVELESKRQFIFRANFQNCSQNSKTALFGFEIDWESIGNLFGLRFQSREAQRSWSFARNFGQNFATASVSLIFAKENSQRSRSILDWQTRTLSVVRRSLEVVDGAIPLDKSRDKAQSIDPTLIPFGISSAGWMSARARASERRSYLPTYLPPRIILPRLRD